MKGLALSSLSGELELVTPNHNAKPIQSIPNLDEKFGPAWRRYVDHYYEPAKPFGEIYCSLPLDAFKRFSFDELCKLHYSRDTMMDKSVRDLFETNERYHIVEKIESSMWRWGVGHGNWNGVVDAYRRIRSFTFVAEPPFEIRLDHSTYHNEYGPGKYSRAYLDGVFGFLIYYKGEHILTIGFSIMSKKRLLIQQVQSAARTGNRGLFKLLANRLEFVIELFQKNFPAYHISIIDGASLVQKTLADYGRGLATTQKWLAHYSEKVEAGRGTEDDHRSILRHQKARDEYEKRISHLRRDAGRIVAFYANKGRFTVGGEPYTSHGLTHYPLAA